MTDLNITQPPARDIIIGLILAFAAVAGLIFGTLDAALLAALLAILIVVSLVRGWALAAWRWLQPHLWQTWRNLVAAFWSLINGRSDDNADTRDPYQVMLGVNPQTGAPDYENLATWGHVYVAGTTRYGKTTMLHNIIHDLISHHSPAELQLLISDPKRVDYGIYHDLQHLAQPLARDRTETVQMTAWLIAEMDRRIAKFEEYSRRALCNNLDRYAQLSGERLPRVIAIYDELADVMCEPLEAHLERLVKLGAAYGIQLILATQRPSAKSIPGEIISQVAGRMVTWMPSAREYGVVSQIPKEVYGEMSKTRGRFMVLSDAGWRITQGRLVPDRQLYTVARAHGGRIRRWPGRTVLAPPAKETAVNWHTLNDDEKVQAILQYRRDLGDWPTYQQTMDRFSISRPTVAKYIQIAREEEE